ncbi:MAG: DUF99 family protein [Salinirussus sp.]
MKAGARALGVAESYDGTKSTLAGAVVRADRVVDGFTFATCTVGGLDATGAIIDCWRRLDRDDVSYLLVAGIAPAWYNVVDLHRIAAVTDRPVLSVSFEESKGLTEPIKSAFDGEDADRRLEIYHDQPKRRRVNLDGEPAFIRAVGIDPTASETVVRAFTPEGGRPEPLRIARQAARAADTFRRDG